MTIRRNYKVKKVKIIKTLRHLHPLFLPEKTTIYSGFFSYEIFECINSAELIKSSNINYSDFIYKINNLKSEKNKEIMDEYKAFPNLEFRKVDSVSSVLDFSIRGDILDIWLPGYDFPVRIEFFGDEVEAMNLYDHYTNRKVKEIDFLVLCNFLPADKGELESIKIKLKDDSLEKIIFTDKSLGRDAENFLRLDQIIETDLVFPPLFFSNTKVAEVEINNLKEQGFNVLIKSKAEKNLEDINFKFSESEFNISKKDLEKLPAGFISNTNKVALFTERELSGVIDLKRSDSGITSKTLQKILRQFEGEVSIGDFVVHEDYGIAIYAGLEQQVVEEVPMDYLLLKFEDEDELYVPIDQVNKITKYLGNEGSTPKLTKLGKKTWKETKAKVRKTAIITAENLIKHYAKRETSKAFKVKEIDSNDYKKFVDKFEYEETPDQTRSINEVIHDLESVTPMNRLLVGDVGFGKTEVILRAAFKLVEEGKQVAVLAPTTILASQHFDVFTERFKEFGISIELLSRFNTTKENRVIVDKINEGNVDIVIGTHRLLSTDVKFKNLGLLVVDEEQKFGVKQKEKIKQINYGVHVLSVSATPIPRSLSLALSSIQDISIISTPPEGRKGVETEIIFENWQKVTEAIQSEVSRGGQVYFIHNRVNSIQGIVSRLKNLLPEISIEFTHGQMRPDSLDRIFTDFYYKKFDVLVSTTIIENGLDLPNVNTVIIHDSHKFGLSQLYQMRGRVGRSEKQAYCYLMAPKPSKEIIESIDSDNQEALKSLLSANSKKQATQKLYMQRLQSLVDNQDLGAGFRIASKDLEIRGAGNILGEKQSGHINGVGYALYIEMLADAIEKIKNQSEIEEKTMIL